MLEGDTPNDQSLAPGLLIATPKLDGGPFERAVIVLLHHDDGDGTIGFVVNKPLDVDFGTIMDSAEQQFVETLPRKISNKTVCFGGPVQMQQLWVMYRDSEGVEYPEPQDPDVADVFDYVTEQETFEFGPNWVLSASSEHIQTVAMNGNPDEFVPVLGYTGWGAGQLRGELEEGSWLTLDFDESFLRDFDGEEAWQKAMDKLGLQADGFYMMGQGGSA